MLFREFLKEKRLEGISTSSIIPQGRCTKQAASTPILAALTKMRKELQAPLILFYAKDFSFSQIAEYLGISVAAVLKLLSKGREELSLAVIPSVARSTASLARHSRHRRGLPLAA
jgi:DNA-directed RNA polymerase specialized sigma24 family protein